MTLSSKTVDADSNMIGCFRVILAVVLAILSDITNRAIVKSLANIIIGGQFKTVIIDLVQLAC